MVALADTRARVAITPADAGAALGAEPPDVSTKRVRVARPTGPELKRIRTCLRTRPPKADKTAMIASFTAAAAAIASTIKSCLAKGGLSFDPLSAFLLMVAGTAAYAAWRKYEDARTATDPHLVEALDDVERLIDETADITAELEHALAARIAAQATGSGRAPHTTRADDP